MKEITIEITQKCLNSCIYCSSCSTNLSKNYLSLETCLKIIDQAKQLNFDHINISGGEPFLHPNIHEIVNHIKEIGMTVDVYSSGVYINCLTGIFHSIPINKKFNADKIIFNMQADVNELHEAIVFKNINQTIRDESILKSVELGFHTEVNIVPMKCNLEHITETVKKAFGLGCSKVNLLGLVMQGRALKNKEKIEMNNEDKIYLDSILTSLKNSYKERIRIGAPLSKDSSIKCNAGKGKLVIRYDGYVYPCEAFKYKDKFNDYEPMNIKEYDLDYICNNSNFLNNINDYICSCKNVSCAECPAQKDLGYDCGYTKDNPKNNKDIEYINSKDQDSHNIFIDHMRGFLAQDINEMNILKIENKNINNSIKQELINKNYLFINKNALEVTKYGYILESKINHEIKIYVPESIKITKDYYNNIIKGDIINMNEFEFDSNLNNEYNLFVEPYYSNNINLNKNTKIKFLSEYISNATYPDKDVIKRNIVICSCDDFIEVLEKNNFYYVGEIGKGVCFVYLYITANQFCTENLLKIKEI